jgi:hypothetical protein
MGDMKAITLHADERLLAWAEERASRENTSIEEQFARWLQDYTGSRRQAAEAMEVIERLSKHIDTSGIKLTREEMNKG